MIIAIILIGILVMLWYGEYDKIPVLLGGLAFVLAYKADSAGYLDENLGEPKGGKPKKSPEPEVKVQTADISAVCTEESAGKAYANGRRGHKMESLMLHYLDCNVAVGRFHEVAGQNRELEWLYTPDESAPENRVYLDLDAYNPEAKVAFEFNGPIHYHCPYRDGIEWRRWLVGRYNDSLKTDICAANGIRLIVIDYTSFDEDYIRSRLWDLGLLHKRMLASDGRHKDFTYIDPAKPPPRDFTDEIKNIKSVRRFGIDAPKIS